MFWYIVLGLFVLDGLFQGLRDRFGDDILAGMKRYKQGLEPDFTGRIDDGKRTLRDLPSPRSTGSRLRKLLRRS
jgi:hypothetical protein